MNALSGARQAMPGGLRGLVARAMAADLRAFVVPGLDIARAGGLDPAGAGLRLADTPRHANVLLIAGPLPPDLLKAACVVWAQMPRPRAILALGADNIAPLPAPDAIGALSQDGLAEGVATLRKAFAIGAFARNVTHFDAPALAARIEYTCPMHPEVISDEPGKCPICGMFLVEREVSGAAPAGDGDHKDHHGQGAHEHGKSAPAQAAQSDHSPHAAHGDAAVYTCPMHPEVTSDSPGSCPKCGMDLVPQDEGDAQSGHAGHSGHGGHEGHDDAQDIPGIEPHFMSMVELTEGKPASPDGLIMEWIEVPFGPFFPGLPGGLGLILTLDGDSVAEARLHGAKPIPLPSGCPVAELPERLAAAFPLTHVAMRALAHRAIAAVGGGAAAPDAAALERERIASHLNWLAGFARQMGLVRLERQGAALQRVLVGAAAADIAAAAPGLRRFLDRVRRTPLLRSKLEGLGGLTGAKGGPVARAAGTAADARAKDQAYDGLDFTPIAGGNGDALARLMQRFAEIGQSLDLIARAGTIASSRPSSPPPSTPPPRAGHGMATVETARGPATLHLTLSDGTVERAHLTTPFEDLAPLATDMVRQMELADALISIGALDLDPRRLAA